jgi:hypothetical protein
LPLVTWLAPDATIIYDEGQLSEVSWGDPMTLTSYILSMAVNTLVTGLIVFKILKVFLQVKAATTSTERILGSGGGTTLRHIIFVIIESGLALFAIQLVRLVFTYMPPVPDRPDLTQIALNFIIGINEMFNVIIRSVHFVFVLLITFTWLGHRTNNYFIAGLNEIVLR